MTNTKNGGILKIALPKPSHTNDEEESESWRNKYLKRRDNLESAEGRRKG